MKTHTKQIDGIKVTAFKDPSTISGEWVVSTSGSTQRFNARKFTMSQAIEHVVDLQKIMNRNKQAW